jgi:hypothetical protein
MKKYVAYAVAAVLGLFVSDFLMLQLVTFRAYNAFLVLLVCAYIGSLFLVYRENARGNAQGATLSFLIPPGLLWMVMEIIIILVGLADELHIPISIVNLIK